MKSWMNTTGVETLRGRPRRRLTVLVVLATVILGLGAFGAGASAGGGRPFASGVTRTVWGTTDPANAPGQTLIASRVTIAAGALIAPHFHQGTQFGRIVKGTLTYHVVSGSVLVTTAAGVTTLSNAPAVIRLHVGDTLVENATLEHWAENRGRFPVVVELSTLLRSGSRPSTPVGGGQAATLRVDVPLVSDATDLRTVNTNVLYGWNHLVGAGSGAGSFPAGPIATDMQGAVSYTSGAGGFSGFVTFTFADGSTIGTRMEGSATKGAEGTGFQATMVILGGTDRYLGATGSGSFTGSRSGVIGSPVMSSFDLFID